ncbi:hypothetical protein [Mycobacteroides chelonae]|uniref:hypothetical protein n=1 Tax=Mycobacteroides chelonae TaxID=1774 RepID=UPI0008A9BBB9|nr:hypothetical protein [Mycobacteroides chelonae]OHU29021.1 hypothetical protein BKG78_23395 [Mycobacteroides chelonae]
MGHYVTIEGSLTPTDWLARGVRRTVAVTDDIRKLVKIGGAIVVAGSLDDPEVAEHGELAPEAETNTESEGAEAQQVLEYPVPPRNASREDWAEFIASRGLGVTEGKTRDELRDIWQEASGES